MIIVMKRNAPEEHVQNVIDQMRSKNLQPMPLIGTERVVIAVIGDERILDAGHLKSLPGVSSVMPVLQPFKLASRETKYENSIIKVNDIEIGGKEVIIMAGPCTVENKQQMEEAAKAVKKAGGKILRGGAFKPRTGPYSFQGLGEEGLKLLRHAADANGLSVITEVMDTQQMKPLNGLHH